MVRRDPALSRKYRWLSQMWHLEAKGDASAPSRSLVLDHMLLSKHWIIWSAIYKMSVVRWLSRHLHGGFTQQRSAAQTLSLTHECSGSLDLRWNASVYFLMLKPGSAKLSGSTASRRLAHSSCGWVLPSVTHKILHRMTVDANNRPHSHEDLTRNRWYCSLLACDEPWTGWW